PGATERDPDRIVARDADRESGHDKLAALLAESPAVRAFVDDNIRIFNGTPGEPRSFDLLDALLGEQSYRLASWRVAGEEINYRRFFDINGLAALRVEDPEVFEEAHALVLRWLCEGKIDGLRIDHPDGLFDPTAYFLDLQEHHFLEHARALHAGGCGREAGSRGFEALAPRLKARWRAEVERDPASPLRKALYVVVEKIQGGKERIPEDWAVHGTTGYRFANAVGGVFVDPAAETAFTETYARFVGEAQDFEELVYRKKQLIMRVSMASELNGLARELNRVSEMNRRSRDFTLNALRRALVEFIALFPVYRTYVDGWRPELDERDVKYIEWTIARAKARNATTNVSIYDFLRDILLRRYPDHLNERERAVMLRFAMKLQQVTGPVMAKGLEDTVFYVYNRFVALNEVGGEPEHFGTSPQTFHLRNEERAESWPASMLTTSTHDTKRSEDVRARLNVLSELPVEWRHQVRRWARQTARHTRALEGRSAPSPNDTYLFFQTVVGAWPMGALAPDSEAFADFRRRVREYMGKAVKEAKEHSSWTNPDEAYDAAVASFVDACLDPKKSPVFLRDVAAFKARIERAGQHNALGQLLLKLMSPGAVDTYQGCELWDLSLVDPDNRRPGDFAARAAALEALEREAQEDAAALCERLSAQLEDGRVKLYLLSSALRLRQRRPQLFREGGYRALEGEGPRAQALVAFAREGAGGHVVACAPRFCLRALEEEGGLAQAYAHTSLLLPADWAGRRLRCVFTGREVRVEAQGRLALAPLLAGFPVVLLEGGAGGGG
ncbi:MAG TPA: malto-oligosyltrehalose synthase, partial [Aggregicoccus sp.]|nr:malto-oligosyltrehalose synthase [Aggregicoccus sp.]